MGLDITHRHLVKYTPSKEDEVDIDFFIIEDENCEYLKEDETIKPYLTTKSIEYHDFEKYFSDLGLDFNDYTWSSISLDGYTFRHKEIDTEKVTIPLDAINVPKYTYSKEMPGFYYETKEYGYQRKGLIPMYYVDYEKGKFKYIVTDKAILEDICNNYTVDKEVVDYDYKENFKKNFLDNFIPGVSFVTFSW